MIHLAERYLEQRRPGMAEQTWKNTKSELERFATAWDKTRRVPNGLSEDWMGDFLAKFRRGEVGGRGKILANSSYNKSLETFKAFLEWGVRRSAFTPFVLDAIRRMPKDEPKEFLRLSAAEVVHMIETCVDPWERWVLAYASQTLGRDSELRNRQVRHLHLDRGELDWYRRKTTDVDRLPVTQPLAQEWDRWVRVYQEKCGSIQKHWPLVPMRHHSYVKGSGFPNVSGQREWLYFPTNPPHELAKIVQKHAARVSGETVEALKGQGVHILRRSMARALYERLRDERHPEPLRVVQAALGHSDGTTTRIYIGVRPDREERNQLLAGSDLLWSPQDNVVELKHHG